MQAFAYASPASVKDAIPLLGSSWHEAEILAGGTDLISRMKDGISSPRRVVNIAGIKELARLEHSEKETRIGALTTFEELIGARKTLPPAMVQAAEGVTSPQIRNMGTVAGDLLQRPRCWYYRAGYGLLARDANGRALVPEGDNRYHAIFGNSGPAYFVSPSSLAPPLIALHARLRLVGPSGAREIPAERFFRIPQSEDEREQALAPNEILTEIIIPAAARAWNNATYEVRQKEALDWPLATASVAVALQAGKIEQVRIVLGHVAPIPWEATPAEEFLAGKELNEASAAQAGDAAVQGATPLSRNRYKVQLARVATKRALLAAASATERGA